MARLFRKDVPLKKPKYLKPHEVKLPPVPDRLHDQMVTLLPVLKSMQARPMDILARIYAYIDEYNKFVATFSVCEKGCSACCHIPVNISRIEAEYISIEAGVAISNKLLVKSGRVACPFLSEGKCSIYKYRPFNCRTFHTLDDPKYCSTDENHAVYGVAAMGYGSDLLAKCADIVRHINNGEYRDIRSYFG